MDYVLYVAGECFLMSANYEYYKLTLSGKFPEKKIGKDINKVYRISIYFIFFSKKGVKYD